MLFYTPSGFLLSLGHGEDSEGQWLAGLGRVGEGWGDRVLPKIYTGEFSTVSQIENSWEVLSNVISRGHFQPNQSMKIL